MQNTACKIIALLLTLVLLLGVVCSLTFAYAVTSTGPLVNIFVPSMETTGPSTEPTTEPTEPSQETTEPSTKPSTEPTEPSVQPTKPSVQPTSPSTAPTVPTTQPTEPVTQTTVPTDAEQPATGDPGYVVIFAVLAILSLSAIIVLLICGGEWKKRK